jgi:hypothetical protein
MVEQRPVIKKTLSFTEGIWWKMFSMCATLFIMSIIRALRTTLPFEDRSSKLGFHPA